MNKYLNGKAATPMANKSYYFKNGTIPLSSLTLGSLLDNAANIYGDSIVIVSHQQGISKSYLEFKNEVETLASGLLAWGLKPGDRIAIFSPNCYEWSLTQFAAAKAGLILVNINFLSQSQEVEYFLKSVSCKAVIAYDKCKKQDYYEILNRIIPNLSTSSPKNLKYEGLPHLKYVIMISEDYKNGTLRFKDVCSARNKESDILLAKIERLIQFDDPVNIQFTSGTTNQAKGAIVTHHNIINNAIYVSQYLRFDLMKPIFCCQVPLFHTFGCGAGTLGTILHGGTCVFPSAGFDASETVKAIEKYRCNAIFGTPTMIIDMIKNYKSLQTDMSSLQQITMAGAPVPDGLLKELHEDLKIPQIRLCYGLTETSPCISACDPNADLEAMLSGYMKPLEELEKYMAKTVTGTITLHPRCQVDDEKVKILDDDGRVVPKGTKGEICVRGYSVFYGYWNNKVKTDEMIDRSKWLHTGDIGVMNEKGYIKVDGRIKDIVIRGGENIWTTEVESFLSTHPAILEVYICGVPDKRLGEELCCWIHLEPGTTLTDEEVRSFCKGKISHYKIPRYIMFVKEFPKTTTGKIRKNEMERISKKLLNLDV